MASVLTKADGKDGALRSARNVSTMAQAAGLQALTETEYVEEGRQLVFREAQWLKDELVRIGYKVFPSEANYIFFKGPGGAL